MTEMTRMDGEVVSSDAADAESVVVAPVRPSGGPRGRTGIVRWLVALVVVALVAGASVAGMNGDDRQRLAAADLADQLQHEALTG